MGKPAPHDSIDEVIHQRSRLAIMASLAPVDSLEFNELKALCRLTDGNLSTHLATLEKAGYVEIEKSFRRKKPLTTVRQTPAGRAAMRAYVEVLRRLLDGTA